MVTRRFERAFALRYLGTDGRDFAWDLIRLALGSVADTVIIPWQDVLNLDSRARMNTPGTPRGNWGWRFAAEQVTSERLERLADLTSVYTRWNGEPPRVYLPPRGVPAPGSGSSAASRQVAPQ